MILEGLVTTLDGDGRCHLAAMGPIVQDDFHTLIFRPFPTSATGQNLLRTREGVFHLTDDVLLIAKIILGIAVEPKYTASAIVKTMTLTESCRAYEFVIRDVDTTAERYRLTAEVAHVTWHRDFLGFNRAKHAVLEAAILASRFSILPREQIDREFAYWRVIVEKTAGPAEREAWALLDAARMAR